MYQVPEQPPQKPSAKSGCLFLITIFLLTTLGVIICAGILYLNMDKPFGSSAPWRPSAALLDLVQG